MTGQSHSAVTYHDRHRVRVVVEPAVELDHVAVHHAVFPGVLLELVALGFRGQPPAQKQVPHVHHVAVFRDLLDRVPAVQQAPSIAWHD